MKIIYTIKTNKIPQIEKAIAKINGKKVKVGVFGEQAWLAGIHEFGCRIKVTDKMRNYLHSQGLHLKPSTQIITIPERSFLRTGYDKNKDDIGKKASQVIRYALYGEINEEEFFKMVGLIMKSNIEDYARDLNTPANHPFTSERKGSSNPLIDTGDMINSISYEVE